MLYLVRTKQKLSSKTMHSQYVVVAETNAGANQKLKESGLLQTDEYIYRTGYLDPDLQTKGTGDIAFLTYTEKEVNLGIML